jgi:arsenate reductase-like glutaredoxin family protein
MLQWLQSIIFSITVDATKHNFDDMLEKKHEEVKKLAQKFVDQLDGKDVSVMQWEEMAIKRPVTLGQHSQHEHGG